MKSKNICKREGCDKPQSHGDFCSEMHAFGHGYENTGKSVEKVRGAAGAGASKVVGAAAVEKVLGASLPGLAHLWRQPPVSGDLCFKPVSTGQTAC